MTLEIKNKKKTGKVINMRSLSKMLLNDQRVNEEIKCEIKTHLETNKMKM